MKQRNMKPITDNTNIYIAILFMLCIAAGVINHV